MDEKSSIHNHYNGESKTTLHSGPDLAHYSQVPQERVSAKVRQVWGNGDWGTTISNKIPLMRCAAMLLFKDVPMSAYHQHPLYHFIALKSCRICNSRLSWEQSDQDLSAPEVITTLSYYES